MTFFRSLPALYYLAVLMVMLSAWVRDVRCLYIAIVCVLVGTVQWFRDDWGDSSDT